MNSDNVVRRRVRWNKSSDKVLKHSIRMLCQISICENHSIVIDRDISYLIDGALIWLAPNPLCGLSRSYISLSV